MPHANQVRFRLATVMLAVIAIWPTSGAEPGRSATCQFPAESLSDCRELGEAARGEAVGIDGGGCGRSPREHLGG